jgi:hypothetical protein
MPSIAISQAKSACFFLVKDLYTINLIEFVHSSYFLFPFSFVDNFYKANYKGIKCNKKGSLATLKNSTGLCVLNMIALLINIAKL